MTDPTLMKVTVELIHEIHGAGDQGLNPEMGGLLHDEDRDIERGAFGEFEKRIHLFLGQATSHPGGSKTCRLLESGHCRRSSVPKVLTNLLTGPHILWIQRLSRFILDPLVDILGHYRTSSLAQVVSANSLPPSRSAT